MKKLFFLLELGCFFCFSSASAFGNDFKAKPVEFVIQPQVLENYAADQVEATRNTITFIPSEARKQFLKKDTKPKTGIKFQDRHRRQVLLNGVFTKY